MSNMSNSRKEKRSGIGNHGTLALFLLAVFLLGLNIFTTRMEKKYGWKTDYSFNGITTQSETTRQVLDELKYPVHIYALFSKGREDAPLLELLDRYAASSDLITWEQTDPSLNPMLLTRFSSMTETVSADSLIVYCETTDRFRILSPASFISLSMDEETGTYTYAGYTYERAITSALVSVTREEIPRITVIQGHGELDGESLSAFDRMMTENHFEVVYRRLSDTDYVPDPAELIAFFSPMRDISETETEKLKTFIDQGGCLLFTCDYTDPVNEMPNYLSILRYYGITPLDGIVIAGAEETDSYYNQVRIDLIPKMNSTSVTMDMLASGADTVLLPGSRAFRTEEETDRNLMVFPVLESGKTSYLKKVSANMTGIGKEDGDEEGPFVLAVQSQRITAGGYVSRAFAAGCSPLFTEEQIYAITDAPQLIVRMTEYLLGQKNTSLNIAPRSAVRPGLSARGNGLGSLIVTILPLSVLAAAMIILLKRRNQ